MNKRLYKRIYDVPLNKIKMEVKTHTINEKEIIIMIKQTVKFTDLEGKERTKDLYFHLTKADLMEMEIYAGGVKERVEKLKDDEDNIGIYEFFKDLIKRSYGVKSDDGISFLKDEKKTQAFLQSEAYSAFLMSLLESEEAAAKFVNGIMPTNTNTAPAPQNRIEIK